jgi:hypothetical protein
MNWLSYVSWLAGPALEITLLSFMIRRKLHVVFPRFFSYIVFQIVKSGVLFVTYRFSYENYFDAYWTGNAISVLLAVTVMDEILHHLFHQYGGIQTLGSTIFRWSCGLLLVVAIVGALSSHEGSADRVVAAVLAFDRSVRLMECGLFFLLMLLCRVLKDCWRQQVFGIALGFGVFASIELILVNIAMRYGDGSAATVSLLKSVAYNAVTLLWIGYLKQQLHAVPQARVVPRVNALNMALAMPMAVPDNESSFIFMVEQAVDRVLSRQTWPRPAVKGPQIVSRRPEPEDSN